MPSATADRIAAAEGLLARHEAEVAASRSLAESRRAAVVDARARRDALDGAHALLLGLAESRREAVRERVERTVAEALRAVFGPSMDFKFEISVSRGAVQLEPLVGYRAAGGTSWAPVEEVGGGVVDVASFALRVAVLLMRRPALRPVLVADEPFKHVSNSRLPAVAAMLRGLADGTGLQLIVVSHEPAIAAAADALLRVTKSGGLSRVDEVSGPVPPPADVGEDDGEGL